MEEPPKIKNKSDKFINTFGAPTLMDMMAAGNNEENPAARCEEEVYDVFSETNIQEDKDVDKIPQEMGEIAQPQPELEQTVNEHDEGKTAVDSLKNIENISKANLENEHELKYAPSMLNGKTVVKNMQGLDCLKQHFRHVTSSNYKHEMHDNEVKSQY